jgi:molybdenum cofactor cytidylyltransferase
VHRPERFAELTGLEPGETITVGALERLLLDSNGGLKGIPANARCMALLNGADTPDIRAQANELAQSLLHAYRSVLVAALGTAGTVFSAYEPAAGVVLAAGAARRFGQQKQLLLWRGQPLVRHAVLAALRGGLSPVVVVTGAYAEGVEAVLRDLPVVFANNPDWAQGQSTSLQTGLRRLSPEIGSAVILLADQPLIPDKLVRTLVETHASTLSPLVAPRVNGQRVNPVLFDSLTFPDLFALTGDTGGRPLFSEPYHYPVAWVDWMEESLFMDVDTEQDYRGLIERENGNATRET